MVWIWKSWLLRTSGVTPAYPGAHLARASSGGARLTRQNGTGNVDSPHPPNAPLLSFPLPIPLSNKLIPYAAFFKPLNSVLQPLSWQMLTFLGSIRIIEYCANPPVSSCLYPFPVPGALELVRALVPRSARTSKQYTYQSVK